ncbi:ChaN family lipoprotein [Pseudothauera rhizosphaerae]|uniref:Haem-binding uptake Tiki superfamily ChaN domain-containing protein n=1 Tax=Pseudothauera rhizosphaerae TaxID=2565932 RepID=A0A4V3WC12_9RHOO|nr:ChaN family lipoprotein [Pseudothauera rhizosphaerae]THF65362.1 hypothetical protein E6O51_01805 [Pseudothauera rhizosphaerae]
MKKAILLVPLLSLAACMSAVPAGSTRHGRACVPDAAWVAPGGGQLNHALLLDGLATNGVVLLGERHDSMAHHRWQLETLAALYARQPDMVIGLEMFPRRVQPALDAWVRGELTEAEFLARSDWAEVWRMDAALYLDIFRFARDHRIPLHALNVERGLIRAVGRAGYDGVPEADREGVGRPAEPATAYADWLRAIQLAHHPARGSEQAARAFVDAQLLWDRAMAEGIVAARAARPGALVVGIIGSGHLRHGWGVPHQLANLGVPTAAVLLPWDRDSRCTDLVAGLAMAVYGIGAEDAADTPLRAAMPRFSAGPG